MEVTRSAQAEVLLRRLSSAVEEGVASKAMQRVPHLVLLAPAFYKDRLRPLLARWLLLLLLQLGLKDLTPAEAASSTTPATLCARGLQPYVREACNRTHPGARLP